MLMPVKFTKVLCVGVMGLFSSVAFSAELNSILESNNFIQRAFLEAKASIEKKSQVVCDAHLIFDNQLNCTDKKTTRVLCFKNPQDLVKAKYMMSDAYSQDLAKKAQGDDAIGDFIAQLESRRDDVIQLANTSIEIQYSVDEQGLVEPVKIEENQDLQPIMNQCGP